MLIQSFVVVIFFSVSLSLPCSDLVRYVDEGCQKRAILKVANDFSGLYSLETNVSIPATINEGIDPIAEIVNLSEVKAHPVDDFIYAVGYPGCVPEIRVTSANFNGKLICKENPHTPTEQHGVSTISVRIVHTSGVQRRRPEAKIESRNIRDAFPENPFLNGFANNFNAFQNGLKDNLQASPVLNNPFSKAPYQGNPFIQNLGIGFRSLKPRQNDAASDCGSNNYNNHLNLINGGQLAVKGDFPWTVAVFLKVGGGRKHEYICAGNQISEKHVLTAGHCTNVAKHRIFVVPGIIHLDDVNLETIFDIAAINKHPKYETRSPNYDMAILTVNKKMPGMPVCLWPDGMSTSQFVGSKGVVLGWGRYNKDRTDVSEWLKIIEIPIVSQETCIFSDIRFRNLITPETFCAGDRDLNGPCSGDSGGGFNMKINGRYHLRGIVSTAISKNKTCDLSHYVIFADIAGQMEWIKRIINF